MKQVGPHPRAVTGYSNVVRVAPGAEHKTIAAALDSIKDASPDKRYAILVVAGTYPESHVQMKPYIDLYGGFADDGDWKNRDVYASPSILDAQKKGPVVIGADHATIDGFVITGGENNAHGGGILCEGVSPTIVNNVIIANHTLKPAIKEGLGKQMANEGAGIALLAGSNAYVANNLIAENSTDTGAGAGITARGKVNAKILRNVFCNNTAGVKDNAQFHGKEGSRCSPGAAIAVNDESSPQISFNVIVLGQAIYRNDAGGIWVEGNSLPLISYNWIAGNTAYDDGGGIYIMGSLYYDEIGERRDSPPDGSVAVEDNFIVGNSSVHGGPGGLRMSRFGRADLRRNRIVANPTEGAHGSESGVICVLEDNIIADNDPTTPKFRAAGTIADRKFDASHYVTEISTKDPLAIDGIDELGGSAVRIGKQWSLIKLAEPDRIIVWGKISDTTATFEILDDYLPLSHGLNKKEKKRVEQKKN